MDPQQQQQDEGLSFEDFCTNIREIVAISDGIGDGWQLVEKQGPDNGLYITKRVNQLLRKHRGEEEDDGGEIMATFEFHVAYNINYGVPVLCFIAWKQDGSLLHMDEYFEYNDMFKDGDISTTLTQLDHPVLCRPFLTLHPCKTRELLDSFQNKSANLVVSWLSVVTPFVKLKLEDNYTKACIKP